MRSKKKPKRVVSNVAPILRASVLIRDAMHRISRYKKNGVIFMQGDQAGHVFFISKGTVHLNVVSKQGKVGTIAILGDGQFFGEGCLVGQPKHIATAKAAEETDIVAISRQVMANALTNDTVFSKQFMTFLLTRSVQVEADLIDHFFNSSEKRLARILLLMASMGQKGRLESIPKVSQEVLAARVGTTRSRINFFMNRFRKLGFIEYNGNLKIHTSLINVIIND